MVTMNWDDIAKSKTEFQIHPHYDSDSDSLTVFIANDESFRERVDSLLTVYRSIKSNAVVGCHIKHVTKIVNTVHAFQLGIQSGRIKIGLILLGLPLTEGERVQLKSADYKEIVGPIAELAGTYEIPVPF